MGLISPTLATGLISEPHGHRPATGVRVAGGDFKSLGLLDDIVVVVIFSLLGTEAISLISVRPASLRERKAYVPRQADDPGYLG